MKCKVCTIGLADRVDELYKKKYRAKDIAKELRANDHKITTNSVRIHIEHNLFGGEIIQKETATVVQKKDVTIPDKVQEYLNMDVNIDKLSTYQKARLQKDWARIGLQGMGMETELKLLRTAMHEIVAKVGKNEA